jgi:hypothetical protein
MPIDRQLDRIKRRRMRHAERKLREAQRQRVRTERSILHWSRVMVTINTNGHVLFSRLCGLKKTRGGHSGAAPNVGNA